MKGLYLDQGSLRYREDLPDPKPGPGEVRVEVLCAGVCATDLALVRGYMDFRGVPGHEFVGRALDGPLAGQRVVGEINAGCGRCAKCATGDPRHCSERSVLGILNHDGAFAESLTLPAANLHAVPEELSTEHATFTEPLAAAFAIPEQVELHSGSRALVAGDGRLGLLCAQVLREAGLEVTVAGRHPERLQPLGGELRAQYGLLEAGASPPSERWDIVVEATGNPDVLQRALACVRPRGTLVLKTTTERAAPIDLAPLVVDEIRMVGSRCGPFAPALQALANGAVLVDPLIERGYSLAEGPRALEHAAEGGVLKILIHVRDE